MAQYALLIVLLVLVVALFIVSYVRRKKYNNELGQMREDLKIGDKVMTDTGVVGEIVDSYVEEEYKYFVLKSGKGNNVGYFSVHANAIYYVFGKEEPKKQNMANVKKEKKPAEQPAQENPQPETKAETPAEQPKTEQPTAEQSTTEPTTPTQETKAQKPKKKNNKK